MPIFYSVTRRAFILSCLASSLMPLIAKVNAAQSKSTPFGSFSFAFLTDCHLSSRLVDNYMLLQESQLFLQDAIKQINFLKPDFVIFGGDQVQGLGDNDANWQLFLDVVQSLDCPWYFVLGESDISGNNAVNKMRTFGRDWRGRGLDNTNSYWSCDPMDGVHLIGLDTSQANSVTGYTEPGQIEWLQTQIDQNAYPITLVVSHHPLLQPGNNYKGADYLLPQAQVVRNILEKSAGNVISISGHTHVNKIQTQQNIHYISSASLDIYPCAFKFVKVRPDQIEIDTYHVNFPALIKKAKDNLLSSFLASSLSKGKSADFVKLALGEHNDQNAKLSLTAAKKF